MAVAAVAVAAIALYVITQPSAPAAKCGDGVCSGETCSSCESDCGACTNGTIPATPTSVSLDPIWELDFHRLVSGTDYGNVLKLSNVVIDEANAKAYVTGRMTPYIAVIDTKTDLLIDVLDPKMPATMGSLLVFDNGLYLFDMTQGKCYSIDLAGGTAAAADKSACTCSNGRPKPCDYGASKAWGGYSFKETGYDSGFPVGWRQDLNAAYGVIEISSPSGAKVGEIIHGPDALYFDIDDTRGKLYATNTGDGTVSVFDLNKLVSTDYCKDNSCFIKDVDIGDAATQLIASGGHLFIRDRLGGSAIYKYDPGAGSIAGKAEDENAEENGIGIWPADMDLSADGKKLYVLSHYGGYFDVIDVASMAVTKKLDLGLPTKARTDSISSMTYDSKRDRVYAVFPELAIVAGINGDGTGLAKVDLTEYGLEAMPNAGPGRINIAVDEETGVVYAHGEVAGAGQTEYKMLALQGSDLSLLKSAATDAKKRDKQELILLCNAEKGVVYYENKIIDAQTLQKIGEFEKGRRVDSFDNARDIVYLDDLPMSGGKGLFEVVVYEYKGGALSRTLHLGTAGDVVNFFFDHGKRELYVLDSANAMIREYDLDSAGTPVASDNMPPPGPGGTSGKPPGGTSGKPPGGTSGKPPGGTTGNLPDGTPGTCGDGVCGPMEQADPQLCPQDCAPKTINGQPGTRKCGDGICEGGVEEQLCPQDCG